MLEFPHFIDNTMRKAFAVCPTKFKYEFGEGLRLADGKAIHLHFGACFATGLEVTRTAFFQHRDTAQFALALGLDAALTAFGFPDVEGTYKTADRLVGALRYYFATWPLESEWIVPIPGGIECTFELPLPVLHPVTGKNLVYVGRYDALGMDSNGILHVVDEKTASKLGDMWDAKWDLDCQLTGYIWSVREQLRRGERMAPAAFNGDVRGLVRAVSILKDSFGHAEVPIIRSAWYIDRWYGQLVRDINRAVESYKSGVWDLALHENACTQFGRKCDYTPLCLTPHPDRIKEGTYTRVIWNPLVKGE